LLPVVQAIAPLAIRGVGIEVLQDPNGLETVTAGTDLNWSYPVLRPVTVLLFDSLKVLLRVYP
jgi:hypothetical protein